MSVSGIQLSVERLANRCLEEGFKSLYTPDLLDFYDFLKFKEKTFQDAHDILELFQKYLIRKMMI